MSQRYHQQKNGEISELHQENGNSDTEKQDGNFDLKGKRMVTWHLIFLVSSVIAILCVDPLFFYIPVIKRNDKCLDLDKRLMITAICLRFVFDLIYVGNIILGYYRRRYEEPSLARRKIIKKYLRQGFLIDIFAVLPIPQILVPITITKVSHIRKVANFFVFLQYVPRVLRIYLSWRKHIKGSNKLYKRVRITIAFNIFLYILASNVLGGLWYFFSVQRETICWRNACRKDITCTLNSLTCDRNSSENYTLLSNSCPINPPNTTLFDFGIFQNALSSGIVSSTNILQKIVHCLWWGLRNLSSLGQNLETSNYIWENYFAIFISIYGLLMLLYFIGNAQTFMQMATEMAAKKAEMKAEKTKKIKRKMISIKSEIKSWVDANQLPCDMEERIINCIQHRLEKKKDFDIEKPILYFSKDLITEIKRHLCLPLLKEVVTNLENQGDQNLLAERICESLKPKYYNDDSYILCEGEPLMMLFITQGNVCCFKTSNCENSTGTDSDAQDIGKGELWGKQLLEWGFNRSSSRTKSAPISTKTIKTHSKVEAFVLTANDLKNLFPMLTRAADLAITVFPKEVFWRKENSLEMSRQSGTSTLIEHNAPKSC